MTLTAVERARKMSTDAATLVTAMPPLRRRSLPPRVKAEARRPRRSPKQEAELAVQWTEEEEEEEEDNEEPLCRVS
jgi:hypothetical protein